MPDLVVLQVALMVRDMFFGIYIELIRLWRDMRYLATFLQRADKWAMTFAMLMLIGVFLPWLSIDGHLTQMGLMGGGGIHLLLALLTIYQVKKVARSQIRAQQSTRRRALLASRLRRISLNYLLIGACSTVLAIYFLGYTASQYVNVNGLIDIRFGFYLTIFAGLAIFFSGLERFMR